MNILTTAGSVAGILFIVALAIYKRRAKSKFEAGNAVILFLAVQGLIAGLKLVIFAFDQDLTTLADRVKIDTNNIVIGGIAIIVVSIQTAVQTFGTKRK